MILGELVSVGGNVNNPRHSSFHCDITFTRWLCQSIFFRRENAVIAKMLLPAATMEKLYACVSSNFSHTL